MATEKLSVLVFSRNDIENTIDLIGHVYNIADEIVLVDSSVKKERMRLHGEKRRRNLTKLKIYYAVALGYPDPLRMWALRKCKNRWVLLIDTDERLGEDLLRDIKTLIQKPGCRAFGIKRYEWVGEKRRKSLFTWQVRLFEKNAVGYKGVPHDQPAITGIERRLGEEYYMEHKLEFINPKRAYDYDRLEAFERFSYANYNKIMLEYFQKAMLAENVSAKDTLGGKVLGAVLEGYETLTLKKPDQELSNFDYFVYHIVKEAAFVIKQRDLGGVLRLVPHGLGYARRVARWKTEPEGRKFFEVLRIVYEIGIIKFLELDKDAAIRRLNAKYSENEQGIDLLIRLLVEKYEKINRLK